MVVMNNFILPLIKTFFIVGITLALLIVLIRYAYIKWTRKLRWFFKYTIFNKQFSIEDIKLCTEMMEKDMDVYRAKASLLLANTPLNRVYEILYIFRKVERELKGGLK